MLPGETILSGAPQICGPNTDLVTSEFYAEDWEMHPKDAEGRPVTVDVLWDVYQSGAGYYIGTFCPHCGPYTRESIYMGKQIAENIYKEHWLPLIVDGKFNVEEYANKWDLLPGERT